MPDLLGLNDATFAENTVNATPQVIDADVMYYSGASLNGGTLVVSGLLAEDVVSILGGGIITYDSATGIIRVNSTIIGTATGGAGADFVVTFNANANYGHLQLLTQSLTYANTRDTPTETRTLTINVTDSTGDDLSGNRYIDVAGAGNPLAGLSGGGILTAAHGDVDDDGDLDALVGFYAGHLNYYENTGTTAAPAFTERSGGALNGDTPILVDIDLDGDIDLLVRNPYGRLVHCDNGLVGASFAIGVTPEADPIVGTAGAETINGAATDDKISGMGGNDVLNGNDGADTIDGGDGQDTLHGGGGDDYLKGGSDADTMHGGAGDDTYVIDHWNDLIIEAASEGIDKARSSVSYQLTVGQQVENLDLLGQGDIDGYGNEFNNVINGNAGRNLLIGDGGDDVINGGGREDELRGSDGADTLNGGSHNDVLYGNEGVDILRGDNGNDRLVSGDGYDDMYGGAGNDTYVIDHHRDDVFEAAGGGIDTVESPVDFTLPDNVENLVMLLGPGGGARSGTGNGLRNTITGTSEINALSGYAEADTLRGAGGNDSLNGGDGADILDGGTGDDGLYGAAGSDRLTGGDGADRFTFGVEDLMAVAVERDQILDLDFTEGDVVSLEYIDANANLGGNQGLRLGREVHQGPRPGGADVRGGGRPDDPAAGRRRRRQVRLLRAHQGRPSRHGRKPPNRPGRYRRRLDSLAAGGEGPSPPEGDGPTPSARSCEIFPLPRIAAPHQVPRDILTPCPGL